MSCTLEQWQHAWPSVLLAFSHAKSFHYACCKLAAAQDLALPEGKHSGLTHRASVGVWEPACQTALLAWRCSPAPPGSPWTEPTADWRHGKFSTGRIVPTPKPAEAVEWQQLTRACLQRCILAHGTEQIASKWETVGGGERLSNFFLIYFFKSSVLQNGQGMHIQSHRATALL